MFTEAFDVFASTLCNLGVVYDKQTAVHKYYQAFYSHKKNRKYEKTESKFKRDAQGFLLLKLTDKTDSDQFDVYSYNDKLYSIIEGVYISPYAKSILQDNLNIVNGLIKMIGATTTEEYEEIILKDKAFNRRFERLNIKEPNKEQVFSILNNSIEPLEKTTDVKFGYYAEERDRILRLIVDATAKDKQNFNDSVAYPASSLQILKRSFAVSLVDDKSIVDLTSIIKAFDESSGYHLPPAIRLELSNYNLSKKSSSKVVEFQKRK